MSPALHHLPMKSRIHPRQHGVVLIVALVALIAISLSAVALIRSVNSSVLMAGSLASRQSVSAVSDIGINNAMNLFAPGNPLAPISTTGAVNTVPYSNQTAYAYLATYYSSYNQKQTSTNISDAYGLPQILSNANLSTFDSTYGTSTGQATTPFATGETYRYIIERMCDVSVSGAIYTQSACVTNGNTINATNNKTPSGNLNIFGPVYRITIRVDAESASGGAAFSPYNTTAFAQVMVILPTN